MSVYVGPLFPTEKSSRWPYTAACHMTADHLNELHVFAEAVGLRAEWFQPKSLPHYDLTRRMRERAVRLGAIELTLREEGAHIRRLRQLVPIESKEDPTRGGDHRGGS